MRDIRQFLVEVPGRLCLFGEHSDWAGQYRKTDPNIVPGYCIVAGTEQHLAARCRAHPGTVVISTVLPDGRMRRSHPVPAAPESLDAAAQADRFFGYALSTAREVIAAHPVTGIHVDIHHADLPVQKGLSSSAAVCVLMARAYGRAYGLDLTAEEEMELAYRGERRAGSECGRMDQICALGRRLSFLTFDGDTLEIEALPVNAALHILIVDLAAAKNTKRILADLNRCYPDATDPRSVAVREALGPGNADILARARTALAAGDAPAVGALMTEAQRLFDDAVAPASAELTAPRLHRLLEHESVRELAWGGKGVGSQGDGCAQLVTRGEPERKELAATLNTELGVDCFPLTLR